MTLAVDTAKKDNNQSINPIKVVENKIIVPLPLWTLNYGYFVYISSPLLLF